MRLTLEQRQAAVASALRALAAEPSREQPPAVEAVVDAVGPRLDALAGQLREVLARLDSVETALLESVWEQPEPVSEPAQVFPAEQPAAAVDAAEAAADGDVPTVSVPALPLGEGRMSSAASRALFGH